jgi:hypothetical protein
MPIINADRLQPTGPDPTGPGPRSADTWPLRDRCRGVGPPCGTLIEPSRQPAYSGGPVVLVYRCSRCHQTRVRLAEDPAWWGPNFICDDNPKRTADLVAESAIQANKWRAMAADHARRAETAAAAPRDQAAGRTLPGSGRGAQAGAAREMTGDA